MKYFYLIFIEDESLLSGQLEEISQDIAILVFENDDDSPKDSLRYFHNKQTNKQTSQQAYTFKPRTVEQVFLDKFLTSSLTRLCDEQFYLDKFSSKGFICSGVLEI